MSGGVGCSPSFLFFFFFFFFGGGELEGKVRRWDGVRSCWTRWMG